MSFKNKPERFQLSINNHRNAVPLVLLTSSPSTVKNYMARISAREKNFVGQMVTESGNVDEWVIKDQVEKTYVFIGSDDDDVKPYDYMYALSDHVKDLRAEKYRLDSNVKLSDDQKYDLTLGWGLGAYAYDKHITRKRELLASLVIPKGVDHDRLLRELNATAWAQDLINDPPSEMHPEALAEEALNLAKHFNARSQMIVGKELLKQNYPLIHAVGRGAATKPEREPRLVDLRWGDPGKPSIVLVGKGVTFDSGGKNLKDTEGMHHMKGDMGGAAHALAVAYMIMDANLPVHLRVLLPVVENSEGPDAFKQGDIIKSRMGDTVEIVNTDAEGRLIMADTLYEASHPVGGKDTPKPGLIFSFATMTWHGYTEFPGFGCAYSNQVKLQDEFLRATRRGQEYFTGRPLMKRLMGELESKNQADVRQCNAEHEDYDDLLAILFLSRYVKKAPWAHAELQVWRSHTHERTHVPPGLAPGGFAQGVRSAFLMIENRYSASRPEPSIQ